MTQKQIIKQLNKIETMQRELVNLKIEIHRSIPEKIQKPSAIEALQLVAGLWKDNPKTAKDLKEVRRRLWGE